jgi:DegV family protein with EDD domain
MIRIVTDSSCDLPDHLIDRHRITVVPLTIRFGDREFIDRIELSNDAFWEMLQEGESLPETAAPSVGRFHAEYTRLSAEGAEAIVVICISSKLSATHQSAVLAAEQFPQGIPVVVIDSGHVSTTLGLIAMEAAEAAARGASLETVEEVTRSAMGRANLYATLDTLEYLKRGGRIGSTAAFFGTLLNVKPIIRFEDGEVAAAGRVRTRKKAVADVVGHVTDLADRIERLAVVHSDPSDLDDFVDRLAEIRDDPPLITRLGPVVGTHAGPGVVGVVYLLASP